MKQEEIIFDKFFQAFPKAFRNSHDEMIIYGPENTYFRLDNITDQTDLDCKVLEYASRQASKGLNPRSRKYHRDGLKIYFNRDFTQDELDTIYTYLGGGIKHTLCRKFIEENFNFELLGMPNKLV